MRIRYQVIFLSMLLLSLSAEAWAECRSPLPDQPTSNELRECFNEIAELRKLITNQLRETQAAYQQQITDLKKTLDAVLPPNAIVAFANENGCPDGWKIYRPALSRVILGAYQTNIERDVAANAGLTPRIINDVGGEERHTLSIAEMPSHLHEVYPHAGLIVGTSGKSAGAGSADPNAPSRTNGVTSAVGGGASHNTMPPYLALFYCVRK